MTRIFRSPCRSGASTGYSSSLPPSTWGGPSQCLYALLGLLKRLALDLQRQNIRFSLLYLGGVDTPFWDTIDLRVEREKMLRPEDAGRWVVEALSPGLNGVLGELVLQPVSHQL